MKKLVMNYQKKQKQAISPSESNDEEGGESESDIEDDLEPEMAHSGNELKEMRQALES